MKFISFIITLLSFSILYSILIKFFAGFGYTFIFESVKLFNLKLDILLDISLNVILKLIP